MKKLMVAIAAVASAFGLYASELEVPTGTSFEYLEAGSAFDKSRDDFGGGGATWWFSTESEVDGTIIAYGEETPAASRPEKFNGDTQYNYLALESTSPLYRGASEKTPLVQTFEEAFTPFEIGATGLYIDQTVKFTAPSDSDATVNLDGGKIAVWLKESGSDDTLTTNLMVTAGYFTSASSSEQKDYVVDFDATTLLGSWHRVTIKTINITDNYLGFIVYIDGVAVTTEEEIADDLEDVGLSALAKKYAAEKKLFPSAVIEGIYAQTVAAVGYNGSGSIDDVSITPIVPAFAKDGVTFDLDWDPAAFTSISAGGQDLDVEEGEAHLDLDQATSLKIVAVPNDDYTVSLKPGSGADIDPTDEMTFIFGSSASGSIVAAFNYFEGADGTTYPTFAAALEAAEEGDTIKLNKSCTIDATTIPETGIAVDKEITLDLAGNDLLVDDEMALFEVSAAFTVVNSGKKDAKIGIENVVEANVFSFVDGGSLTIGTVDNQDKFVVVQGMASDGDAPVIYQGKFDKDLNTDMEEFAWLDGVPEEGYDVTSDANYWIVQKSGLPPPPPVLYPVRWNAPEHVASIVAKVNGDEIEQGDEFETGTEVEFTVQTANYYGYDTENPPEGWEILDDTEVNTTVSGTFVVGDADLDVAIPTPAGKTYEINYRWYNNDEGGTQMAPLEPNKLPLSFVYGETVDFKPEMVTDDHPEVETVIITPRLTDPITGSVQIEITFKKGGWDPTVDPTVPASEKGIEGKLANASFKDLSTWAQTYGVDFKTGNMDEYADAFLLDCDPDEVADAKKEFKFASITQDAEGNWVVVINNEDLRGDQHFYGNGIAIVTRYSDVECKTQADDGNFFKASLEVYSVATPE